MTYHLPQNAVNSIFEAYTFYPALKQLLIEKTEAQISVSYCSSNMLPLFSKDWFSKSINSKLEFISLCKQCQPFSQATTFNKYLSVSALKYHIIKINLFGVVKLAARNIIYSHLFKISLDIPAPSICPTDRCSGVFLQNTPKAVDFVSWEYRWTGLSKWMRWSWGWGTRQKGWYLLIR